MPDFIPDTELQLQPCDVFLTNGTSFVSKAIRFFTRRIGESRTQANHVEIIVQEGTEHSALAVEALALVRRHALGRYASKEKTKVAVFHPINLTADEKDRIVARANSHVGRKYGVLRIVTHALDWALQGAYVFRRLTNEDNYPICSRVVARAFKAAHKDFGIEAGAASPTTSGISSRTRRMRTRTSRSADSSHFPDLRVVERV